MIESWTPQAKVTALVTSAFSTVSVYTIFGTTALAYVVYAANLLNLSEFLATNVSRFLTVGTGYEITFSDAEGIASRGFIRLKNVSVRRTAETAAVIVNQKKKNSHYSHLISSDLGTNTDANTDTATDTESSYIDLKIGHVDVKLSFMKFLMGNGILEEIAVHTVRGTIDQRHLTWNEEFIPPIRGWKRGYFDLKHVQGDDIKVNILNKAGMTAFPVTNICIFSVELDVLRQQYMLHDILCAKYMSGSYNGRLFTLTGPHRGSGKERSTFCLNGLHIREISAVSSGPLSWLSEGLVDIKVDIRWPFATDINNITVGESDRVIFDVTFDFFNLHATLPQKIAEFDYLSSMIIRPIVLYINNNYIHIPMSMKISLSHDSFDGAFYFCDTMLFKKLNQAVGKEFAVMVLSSPHPGSLLRISQHIVNSIQRSFRRLVDRVYSTFYFLFFDPDDYAYLLYPSSNKFFMQ